MRKHKAVSLILTLFMVLTMIPSVAFAGSSAEAADTKTNQAYEDMTGHWAAASVAKWSGLGIVKGDERGFRPDDSITRAEMAVILDNLMDYQTKAENKFVDVKSGAWYADAVLKVNAAGILNGDGAGHALPSAKVTREQAAVMLARAFGADENSGNKTTFQDAANISAWAKPLVLGMESNRYIGGTGKGFFEPKANITRAQVVTIIDNAVKAYYTTEGTYTENIRPAGVGANCVAIVKTSGVTLKDLKISGDLIVAEGVGTGDFTLDGATVTGKLIARGGGENSIHVINGADVKGKVSIQKIDGAVRIVTDGVVIANLDADAEVILEGNFTNVVVAEGASVEVRGQVTNLEVTAKAEIKLTKDAKVGTVEVAKEAEGTNLYIDKTAELKTLKTEAKMTTSGDGAPKAVTGTGIVTDKETDKTEGSGSSSGGGGGSSNNGTPGSTTDKRSISFEDDGSFTTIVKGKSSYSGYIYLSGTNEAGATCNALTLGTLSIKCDGTPLTTQYSISVASDYISIEDSYINTFNEGKHTVEITITASGKVFALNYYIYIIPTAATILYDQPQNANLQIYEYTGTFGSGTRGALLSSGGSMALASNKRIEIVLTGLPEDKRIKSVSITKSYYGFTQTDDYTDYFISASSDILYSPRGTVTIQVVTEDVPSSLPEISGVEFYLDYDYKTGTYSNPITTTVPAMVPGDDSTLYAKVLFADGKTSNFVNYLWQVETDSGTYIDLFSTNYNYMPLYEAGTDSGHRYKVTASGYEKQTQGTVSAIIYVSEPIHSQGQPTGLTTSSVTAAATADGKIGNTTTDMEYKQQSASDSAYVTCMAGETTGLAAGTYYVRLKAKPGYSAGYPVTITINQPQAAPTGLTVEAPTTPYGSGKIKGTTTLMEYKKTTEPESYYMLCSAGETTGFMVTAGTYSVRFKAKTGYDAGAAATITVPAYVNQDQAAPTGLVTEPTTSYKAQNGKITNTTDAMEYKLESAPDSSYYTCGATQTTYLGAGTYLVRYKAKTGYNAGATATVIITAPAAKTIATLNGLGVTYYSDSATETQSVDSFSPSTFNYNKTIYGATIGNMLALSENTPENSYETIQTSSVVLNPGEYTTTVSIKVIAEDDVTTNTYNVSITVERRTMTFNTVEYTMDTNSSTCGAVVNPVFTDKDGITCSMASLGGDVTIKLQDGTVVDPQNSMFEDNYSVDKTNNTITILPTYLNTLSAGTHYFNFRVMTSDGFELHPPYYGYLRVIVK